MLLNHYMKMMLIVGDEFIHANLDVIGDECMYIHIAVDYEELYGVVELYDIVDVDYSH
jgi:hypothetical protein